ncbi:uroplakin-3b [Scyliorhinus canicula]|uniref:uroplakin-3b n=1 Tax=Scyliorhinus canicula TaxID=7830 RepID=UPI0018F2F202|nr:uroplakin-3b [Scyliorhinus canicula]
MKSLVQVVLLCILCGAANGVPTKVAYTPEIVPTRVEGRITQTTVALEQPRCVFDSIETSCTTCKIWLIVANSTGVTRFDQMKNDFLNTSALSYKDAFTGPNGFYFTVKTERDFYVCPPTATPNEILALRVGSEVPCKTPNCNVPLPTGGTFRMKYVLVDPDLTTPNIVAETEYTQVIQLRSATDPNSIDTNPGRRTGGMIVITVILAILLFLLLAMFAAMLAFACCRKFDQPDFSVPQTTSGSLRKYHTHSLHNPSGAIAQKANM